MLSGKGEINVHGFFVRARMSASEYSYNEVSTCQDHTYCVFLQNTTCGSAAADLAREMVEDLS